MEQFQGLDCGHYLTEIASRWISLNYRVLLISPSKAPLYASQSSRAIKVLVTVGSTDAGKVAYRSVPALQQILARLLPFSFPSHTNSGTDSSMLFPLLPTIRVWED